MDKNVKKLKRRILNGINRQQQREVYLAGERNANGTRIANIYYTNGCRELRVKLEKYVAKRNRYELAGERIYVTDAADIQRALDYVAAFINK